MQSPQCMTLLARLTSHPLAITPSQSAYPASHPPMTHVAPAHFGYPLGRGPQTLPHIPQLNALVANSVSQPLQMLLSQSSNPGVHAPTAQTPLEQPGAAFGVAGHVVPQVPQLNGSAPVLTSQPSTASALQLVYPGRHAPKIHAPASHVGCELAGGVHKFPQPPQ